MTENPIPAIEEAELAAKLTVQKANDEKSSLINAAREKAAQNFTKAVQTAEKEGERLRMEADKSCKDAIEKLNASFEKEKSAVSGKAKKAESKAIGKIIEIINV